jgi:AcrR family transcriptional regulator
MTRNLQEHILKTASELFYCHGIKATGIDTIIKATGVAKMSLYKYFPSKNDLILAHLQRSAVFLTNSIINGISQKAKQPDQQLLAIFDVFDEIVCNPEFRGCPFINATAEFAETGHPVQQATAKFYQGFCEIMSDLARQAGAKDADLLAEQLAMLISGAIVREQVQKGIGAIPTAKAAAEVLILQSLQTKT